MGVHKSLATLWLITLFAVWSADTQTATHPQVHKHGDTYTHTHTHTHTYTRTQGESWGAGRNWKESGGWREGEGGGVRGEMKEKKNADMGENG
jgi:hypothetical protein